MRTFPTVAAMCTGLLLLVGCSTSATQDPGPQAAAKPILTKPDRSDDLLFVARSKTATIDLDANGNGTLRLPETPTMTWFSDRPDHDAGTTTTSEALGAFGWKKAGDTLGRYAPNAALTADNLPEAVVVELTTATRTHGGVTFAVTAVAVKPTRTPTLQGAEAVDLVNAELFIDSVVPEGCVVYPPAADRRYLSKVDAFFGGTNAHAPLMVTGDVRIDDDGKQFANLTLRGFDAYWSGSPSDDPNVSPYKLTLTEDEPALRDKSLNLAGVELELHTIELRPALAGTEERPAKAGHVTLHAENGPSTYYRDVASYELPC